MRNVVLGVGLGTALAAGPPPGNASGMSVQGLGTLTPRQLQTRVVDRLNWLDFGAVAGGSCVANGATNAAAFTSAVALAAANSTAGKAVYLPAGIYYTNPLVLNGEGVSVFGDGRQSTILIPCVTSGNFFSVTGLGNNDIWGLSLQANQAGAANSAGFYTNTGNTQMYDVEVQQLYGTSGSFFNNFVFDSNALFFSLDLFYSNSAQANGILFGNSTHTGTTTLAGTISRGWMFSNGRGILILEGAGINFRELEIALSSNGPAVETYPRAGQSVIGLDFYNVIADSGTNASAYGYQFYSNGGLVSGVWCVDCQSGYATGGGVNISGDTAAHVQGISWIGGSVLNNAKTGITIGNALDTLIQGTQVCNNGQGNIGGYQGIAVAGGTGRFQIVGNTVGACSIPNQQGGANGQSWGVLVIPGASDQYLIEGNNLLYNQAGGVLDQGTGTNKVVCNNLPNGYCQTAGQITYPAGTLASLPACTSANLGARSQITDSAGLATFLSLAIGGGVNRLPVWCNGSNWLVE